MVEGSIPDGFIAIFHSLDLFGRTVIILSTQPLAEISIRELSYRVKAAGA
jgi:hypothetical protein